MNLNKILAVSLLVLVISTFQTDSGIIFSLLMKVLLLKGALFMTTPLCIGAFMMGQGTGFFAGNMMGGYMMLRAANRYHTKEKVKWTSSYGSGTGGDYGHNSHFPTHGWNSQNKYQNAYDKGKDIGAALHALADHKTKLASAFNKIKNYWVPKSPNKGWGGWGQNNGGYSYHNHHKGHDHGHYQYTSHTKYQPVTSKYKFNPYGHLETDANLYGHDDHSSGYGDPHYEAYETPNTQYRSKGSNSKGHYSNSYYPQPSSSIHQSSYDTKVVQDPSNTYYTSAYEGPGSEYDGILTNSELLESYLQSAAEEKSSSEDDSAYQDIPRTTPTTPSTISPNPILEKYLEKRLEEEATKQKNFEQQQEAKQLIQMLRKAYLRQLVDSLKEEEKSNIVSSTESMRESRSAEESIKNSNIMKQLLSYKFKKSGQEISRSDTIASESVIKPSFINTGLDITTSTSTEKTTKGSTTSTPKIESLTSTEQSTTSTLTTLPKSLAEEEEEEYEDEEGENETNIISSTDNSPVEFNQMPAMWVRAENTFSDESTPFVIRIKNSNPRSKRGTQESVQGYSSPESNPTDTEKQITSFVDDIKKFFTLLTVLDQDQCLQKLVCDVHTNQKDPATLTQYEQNILTTFRLMKALMPEGEEDSSTKYRRAALIGETGQSLELCQQTFSTCGFSSNQIITLGSQAEASQDDWASVEGVSGQGRSEYVTMPRVRRELRNFYL